MKSNYIVRAKKFLLDFIPFFEAYKRIEDAVNAYNLTKRRHVQYFHGAARRCLCLSDYAVKWDYDAYNVKRYGGCEAEVTNYRFACDHGYEYLFAEITRVEIMGHVFYIMPRVKKLGISTDSYSPDEYMSMDEFEFVYGVMGLYDLHDENWGLVCGQVKIIDYACYHRDE